MRYVKTENKIWFNCITAGRPYEANFTHGIVTGKQLNQILFSVFT